MCDNNDDGFAIVWKAGNEPVRNYRTLNKDKFLNKYKEITAKHDASDVAMFIHAKNQDAWNAEVGKLSWLD